MTLVVVGLRKHIMNNFVFSQFGPVLLVLIIIIIMRRLLDVKVWKEEGGGMSDHFLVEARLKLVGEWRSAGMMEGVRNVLKVST